MPPSAGSRRPGRRIRAELLRRGVLRAVIALPANVVPLTAVPMQLWLLTRPPGAAGAATRLLFAECPTRPADDRAWNADQWRETIAQLHGLWRRFLAESSVDEPQAGVRSAAVALIDLLDDEVDLTPARWLPPLATATPADQLPQLREQLTDLLDCLPGLVPAIADGPAEPLPAATVADLVRTGGLSWQISKIKSGSADENGPPMLTVDDLRSGAAPSRRAPAGVDTVRLRPGDVVVPQVGRAILVRVATDAEHGAVLGPNLALLRPDKTVYDPWFVAGFLARPANVQQATTTSAHRVDIRRAELPRGVPLAEQHRYAEAFRRLAELERTLSTAGALAAELRQVLSEGLANGSVGP
jgi:hypothetical protein